MSRRRSAAVTHRGRAERLRAAATALTYAAAALPYDDRRADLEAAAQRARAWAEAEDAAAAVEAAREASPPVPEARPVPRGELGPLFGALRSPQGAHSTGNR